MTEAETRGLFEVSGFRVERIYRLENQYWPLAPDYDQLRRESPWWLVKTPIGLIMVGWRKRVLSIDWEDTSIRAVVTEDDVTKDQTMVHAYSMAKAVEYLTGLRQALNGQAREATA
ncbi:hypothetical protein BN2476_830024 [Paraburkholderia piptadeniae]|uniref:Uncharacterized protein n=1 Tax=Paraburkholderia piptadeniae TaxID=1701573 RepID=A0A1N7SST5_9BURK|nr:hypothetical protein [Paraburkholderia piptadeniae]SIT50453.1 hypothetical protein BN2476_830024 [Paraburkholderia piptadeniae]